MLNTVCLPTQQLAKSWTVLNKIGRLVNNKHKEGTTHRDSEMPHDPGVMIQEFFVSCVDVHGGKQKNAGDRQDHRVKSVT